MSKTLVFVCLMGSVLAVAAAFQQVPAAPRYEISGTVVDPLANRPIARALVRLSPLTGRGQLISLTAENGQFEFSNIPKGKYRLSAQRRGQFPQAFHQTGQYSTAIVVGPGLDATSIVFPLNAPASISVLVLDEDGEPVQSANVTLFHEAVIEGDRRTMQIGGGNTNSLGVFRNGQLAAGTYYAAVQLVRSYQDPGFARDGTGADLVYPLTWYGDTTDAQAAATINVAEGSTAQIQVNLHPVPGIHVPIPEAQPHKGPSAQVLLRAPGGLLIPADAMYWSNSEGAQLSGIPAGRYFVQANSESNGRFEQGSIHEMDLADGIPLAQPQTQGPIKVSGHLTFEGGQRPANGLQLLAGRQPEQSLTPVQVEADGAFSFSRFLPGLYSVQLNGSDYYIKSMAAKGARLIGDRLELTEGVSVTLSILAAPAANLSKLDGFALRDGKPVPAAMVLLVPADVNRTLLFRRDQTDSDGSFTIAAIPPGKYTIVGIDDDGRNLAYKDPAVIQPYLVGGQSLNFPLRLTEPVKVTVQPRLR